MCYVNYVSSLLDHCSSPKIQLNIWTKFPLTHFRPIREGSSGSRDSIMTSSRKWLKILKISKKFKPCHVVYQWDCWPPSDTKKVKQICLGHFWVIFGPLWRQFSYDVIFFENSWFFQSMSCSISIKLPSYYFDKFQSIPYDICWI